MATVAQRLPGADLEQNQESPEARQQINRHSLLGIAKHCPLFAAIVAPYLFLLDLMSLFDPWYSFEEVEQPDPIASTILSSTSLVFNILANITLVFRFAGTSTKWWQRGRQLSLMFWVAKTVVAMVNVLVFGIRIPQEQEVRYTEGFWCATFSVVLAGVISIALLFHWFFFDQDLVDPEDIRSQGRGFMQSVAILISGLAIEALVFSQIEEWSYSNAVYYSVQVALTITYGDFTPQTEAGKILSGPFALLAMASLGTQITLVVAYLTTRADVISLEWRSRYEGAAQRKARQRQPNASLKDEIVLVDQIDLKGELVSRVRDLVLCALVFFPLWLIGTTVFSIIEGWLFQDSLYAVMNMFQFIGLYDYPMSQPASKVCFIVYGLMAIPIVAAFAVQTVKGCIALCRRSWDSKAAFDRVIELRPDLFDSHADFMLKSYNSYYKPEGEPEESNDEPNGEGEEEEDVGDARHQGSEAGDPDPPVEEGIRDSDAGAEEAIISQEDKEDGDRGKHGQRREDGEDDAGLDGEGQNDQETNRAIRRQNGRAKSKKRRNRSKAEKKRRLKSKKRRSKAKAKTSSSSVQGLSIGSPVTDPEATANELGATPGQTINNSVDDCKPVTNVKSKESAEDRKRSKLLRQISTLVNKWEDETTQLLVDILKPGTVRSLLRAERNVRARLVEGLHNHEGSASSSKGDKPSDLSEVMELSAEQAEARDFDILSGIKRFRSTFAEIVVLIAIIEGNDVPGMERFQCYHDDTKRQGQDGLHRSDRDGIQLRYLGDGMRRFNMGPKDMWNAVSGVV